MSILLALSRKLALSQDVNLEEIAVNAEGFTGADLQAVLYTAQLAAVEQTIPSEGNRNYFYSCIYCVSLIVHMVGYIK